MNLATIFVEFSKMQVIYVYKFTLISVSWSPLFVSFVYAVAEVSVGSQLRQGLITRLVPFPMAVLIEPGGWRFEVCWSRSKVINLVHARSWVCRRSRVSSSDTGWHPGVASCFATSVETLIGRFVACVVEVLQTWVSRCWLTVVIIEVRIVYGLMWPMQGIPSWASTSSLIASSWTADEVTWFHVR